MISEAAGRVVSLFDGLHTFDQAVINQSSDTLMTLMLNPAILPVLRDIYIGSGSEYHKQCAIMCYDKCIVGKANMMSPECLLFVQNSLIELMGIERDVRRLDGLMMLVVSIMKQTGSSWPLLDAFISAEPQNYEIYMYLFVRYLRLENGRPIDNDALERMLIPRLEMALNGDFHDQMSGLCAIMSWNHALLTRFVPLLRGIYAKVFEQESEERVKAFFDILGFCFRCEIDVAIIEEICPVATVIETVMLPVVSYTSRMVIRDWLKTRFRYMKPEMSIGVMIMDRMIGLSVWFFTEEIDEATTTFDDFRGIVQWFGDQAVTVITSRIEALLTTPSAANICCALDLVRALVSVYGATPGAMNFFINALSMEADYRVNVLVALTIIDFRQTLRDEIENKFTVLVGLAVKWANAVLSTEPIERQELTIPAMNFIVNLIHVGRSDLDPVFEGLFAMAVGFCQHGTPSERYYAILLVEQTLQTPTSKIVDQCGNIMTMILTFMTCSDEQIREICYPAIPLLARQSVDMVLQALPTIFEIIRNETHVPCMIRALEMTGRLALVTPHVRPYMETAIGMAVKLVREVDVMDDMNILLGVLVSISRAFDSYAPACLPVIIEGITKIMSESQHTSISCLPGVADTLILQGCDESIISGLVDRIWAIMRENMVSDTVFIPFVKTLSVIMERDAATNPDTISQLAEFILTRLKELFVDFKFDGTSSSVVDVCSSFLQSYISNAREQSAVLMIGKYTAEMMKSENMVARSNGFLLLAYIIQCAPDRVEHTSLVDVLVHATNAVTHNEPRVAKSAAYLIKSICKSGYQTIVGDMRAQIYERLTARLTAHVSESTIVMDLRDNIISALIALNKVFGLEPFGAFLTRVEAFLPAISDLSEFEDIYSYFCENFEGAPDDVKVKYFIMIATLAPSTAMIPKYVEEGEIEYDTIVRLYQILKAFMDSVANPKEEVFRVFGRDEAKISEFTSFINMLAFMASNKPAD